MGISRDKIRDRKPGRTNRKPGRTNRKPGRTVLFGENSRSAGAKLLLLDVTLKAIRSLYAADAQVGTNRAPSFLSHYDLWASVWHNLKLLADYASKRRGHLPNGWASSLAELRGILAISPPDDMMIEQTDRLRIEKLLSQIEGRTRK
jgi:hypothetical protein